MLISVIKHKFITQSDFRLEMAKLGPARGPKRAGPGRAGLGPENPGPRALRAETGLMIFYLRFLCALCWPLGSNKGIMYCCYL